MLRPLTALSERIPKALLPCFLLAVFIFLYLKTFIFPAVPIYQGANAPVFLLEARRMLDGQIIYRDFFELVFPGMPLTYAALFKLFGVKAWIPAALLAVAGTALAWLSVVISRKLVGGALVYLPGALYVTLALGNALDATHHWISILALMAALAVIVEVRSPARLLAAGMLCGVATCFTQSRGALCLVAFSAFLLWERQTKKQDLKWLAQREGGLLAGYLLASLPPVLYFGLKAGFGRFFYCTFAFVTRYYSSFDRNNLGVFMVDVPEMKGILLVPAIAIWLFIHLVAPLIYILLLVRYARKPAGADSRPWDRLMLVNSLGLAFFLAIVSAPNWFKVASASLPALILLAWFLDSPGRFPQVARGLLGLAALGVGLATPLITQFDWHGVLETPVGRVAVLDADRSDKYQWVLERTRPGESILEAGDTDLYFLCGLENPTETAFLTPTDYTRPEQVERAVAALQQGVPMVLWSPWLDLPDNRHRAGDHLGALRASLRDSYRVVKTFRDGDQMWERKVGGRDRKVP